MVEVFKTNVTDHAVAKDLIAEIHTRFDSYRANFDLEDCDRILRIKSVEEAICVSAVIALLQQLGWQAMVLEDEVW